MLGAIAGDIIGSVYEFDNIKTKEFELFDYSSHRLNFTDDTVLTVALMDAIMNDLDFIKTMHRYFSKYPSAGYGGNFYHWCENQETEPYESWGNGSAMRTSAVGYAYNTMEEVLDKAEDFAAVTHNHPEGIKGAQAVSAAIFMARNDASKDEIQEFIVEQFDYDVETPLDEIRPDYVFDVSCQGSVPEAIICFLESTSFEDAIRNAVSLGGDSDTIACITGSIAEAHYGGVPYNISNVALGFLPADLLDVVVGFYKNYGLSLGAHYA